jgi:thioredoxin-related protein
MFFPVLASVAAGKAVAHSLRHPTSLRDELRQALAVRKALIVMVSLEGCPYCKLVRESYLVPLRTGGQPVVQLELNGSESLHDLQGRASSQAQVVRGFGVRLAPTVLFLGRGGAELAPRLTGVANPDFYGAYLQERVEAANRSVAV